ncbi:hypothetical protein phiA047_0012 [Aeromonas phage phiA047]|nr:hypothetical protein phiA047_0012 [Aeromonas phage phiA047]
MKITTVTDLDVSSKDLMDEFIRRSRYFSDGYSIHNDVVYNYERTGWNSYDNVEIINQELISNVRCEYEILKTVEQFLNSTKKYSEPKLENFK